jgi:hypothetical protein
MPKRVTVNINGQEREAVEVDFTIKREDWNEYELADGGRVRMRTAVHRMLRVLDQDGRPARNEAGDPFIIVQSQNAVVASD